VVDFAAVSAAALARAETLVAEWLPQGRRRGSEWVCGSLSGDAGESCSINLTTGKWAEFAGDERGGDLVSLYAAIHRLSQADACRELARQFGLANGHDASPTRLTLAPKPTERPAEPAPTDVALPAPHPVHGAPSASYCYVDAEGRLLFVVCRYDLAAGKKFAQYSWRGGRWSAQAYPQPRPLYGLLRLALEPNRPVLVVEGEKAHAAATELFPGYCVITWAGGASSVKTADWAVLAARDVVLWPDADEPGRKAMAWLAAQLVGSAQRVRVVDTEGQPEGWDLADARAEGWDSKRTAEWAKPRARQIDAAEVLSSGKGRAHDGVAPIEANPVAQSAVAVWQQCGINANGRANSGGIPHATESNVALLVSNHPRTASSLHYDTFRDLVCFTDETGHTRPWTDLDTLKFLDWCQGHLQLAKMRKSVVFDGVLIAALRRKRSSVVSWLESLEWDGEERLGAWLQRYLGAPADEHHAALGRNWLIAMVARAFEPGCQMHNIIVLEGLSGTGKSTTLKILGGEWYASLSQRFASKEFIEAMQGKWLIEIPDRAGFKASSHLDSIAFISRAEDNYRVPWDRLASDHPRRCVLAMSTESCGEYLQDIDGIRRFWTVSCAAQIDLEGLRSVRSQLFAEAVASYKAGVSYHLMPAETGSAQLQRIERDIYQDRLADWLAFKGKTETTALEVYEEVFASRDSFGRITRLADQRDKVRISRALRLLGWRPLVMWRDGRKVNGWFKLPERPSP
jgi:putative DNA primase/helicase